MDIRWDLSPLYDNFDSPAIVADLEKSQTLINQLTKYVNEQLTHGQLDHQAILTYYDLTNQLSYQLDRLINFGSLSYSVDTANSKALALIEELEALSPQLTLIEVTFKKWLKSLPDLSSAIETDERLQAYRYLLLSEQQNATYLLSDSEESLLADLRNTGSNAWSKLQDQTVSNLTAEFDGQTVPLSVIRSKAYDKEATVRQAAYQAELRCYEKVDKFSAASLNAIKGEVISVAKRRGYLSPLDMTLQSARMDRQTLDAMLQAIKEYLPEFGRYFRKKATLLGHSDSLPFYDLFAPIDESSSTYSYEEAQSYVLKNFYAFSDDLGDFAKKAFDNNWIDVYPRTGKVAGAFCASLYDLKESRLMLNYDGSLNDILTLAHELGHGYHNECLKDVDYVNSAPLPMQLAETASIFCETIVTNASLKEANPAEQKIILENSLMGSSQVIVDIYSRYLFESRLFEERQKGSVSVEQLKQLMLDAQTEAYGDALQTDKRHPYMWLCKPHYYSADINFYNFPYAFGLLFAKGLYAMYEKEGQPFVQKYQQLLKITGSESTHQVLASIGIDSHQPDFFRGSLELIKREIDAFVNL